MNSPNAETDIERFRNLVIGDQELQRKLQAHPIEGFEEFLSTLAAQFDCQISESDIQAALQQARRVWIERWLV